jgi:thymidylate synthase ThyX
MSHEVSIVADSVGSNGVRLTTFKLKYPRMIHSEFMTHRAISRNASSTRAIPVAKMIEWVERDPAMPVFWGANQSGMQATKELPDWDIRKCQYAWLNAKDEAVYFARRMMEVGTHKQLASRLLEPFAHINVVATATNWDNFFALRCSKYAMPEIQVLAVKMARAYRDSTPEYVESEEWHLPFVTEDEFNDDWIADQLKYSVARCARVSFETFDGKAPDREADIALHDRLRDNGHWSPFEHQGQATRHREHSGNLIGWNQYRQTLATSVHETFDFSILDRDYADRDFIV